MSSRIGRWWLEVQEFDFDVIYRDGTQMKHVNAFSQKPINVNLTTESDWLQCVQAQDKECSRIKNKINNKDTHEYKLVDNKICRVLNKKTKFFIPKDIRWQIVKQHDGSEHPGSKKTVKAISKKYWFSQMKGFVTIYVNSCISCLCSKIPRGKRRGFLYPIEKPAQPFTLFI